MQLSGHFSLAELTVTNSGLSNAPSMNAIGRLKRLAEMLEQVRIMCDSKPVVVSSGFRSEAVNNHVGGSKTSAHLRGDAADFAVRGLTIKDVFERIKKSELKFDQLILEPTWIHLGLSDSPRRQCLTFNGKTYANV